jgi:hypothetical protein
LVDIFAGKYKVDFLRNNIRKNQAFLFLKNQNKIFIHISLFEFVLNLFHIVISIPLDRNFFN